MLHPDITLDGVMLDRGQREAASSLPSFNMYSRLFPLSMALVVTSPQAYFQSSLFSWNWKMYAWI